MASFWIQKGGVELVPSLYLSRGSVIVLKREYLTGIMFNSSIHWNCHDQFQYWCLCAVRSLKKNRNFLYNRYLVNAGHTITWKVIINIWKNTLRSPWMCTSWEIWKEVWNSLINLLNRTWTMQIKYLKKQQLNINAINGKYNGLFRLFFFHCIMNSGKTLGIMKN